MRLILICMLVCIACQKKEEIPIKSTQVEQPKEIKKDTVKPAPKKDLSKYKAPTGIYRGKNTPFMTTTIRTNFGDMKFELFPNESPLATESFVNLAKAGFYNGNQFFRVVRNFVVQTGDPTNTGYGDAGYKFKTETHDDLSHDRIGILSFANVSKETNSSQFFITLSAQNHLDANHPIFGILMSGEDVLRKIGDVAVDKNDRPIEAVVVEAIVVE